MVEFPRKAYGRRVFSVAFKRETVGRITSGEKTLAGLSRELDISPSVLRNWMRLVERGGTSAVAAGEDVVPAITFCISHVPNVGPSGQFVTIFLKSQ